MAESNGSCSQANQASISGMGLMNGVGKLVAELLKNGLDSGVVSGYH